MIPPVLSRSGARRGVGLLVLLLACGLPECVLAAQGLSALTTQPGLIQVVAADSVNNNGPSSGKPGTSPVR